MRAFGVSTAAGSGGGVYRTVRESGPVTLFTIGYEGRNGEELIAALRDAGVEHLADIREKPVSRKPDFRAGALRARCDDAGIEYGAWTELGSSEEQRDRLNETGDLAGFHRVFRQYAARRLESGIEGLARLARTRVVALMCYERAHEECHRSVIAELLAERLDAGVTAIL